VCGRIIALSAGAIAGSGGTSSGVVALHGEDVDTGGETGGNPPTHLA
jgi:hypothetical protein